MEKSSNKSISSFLLSNFKALKGQPSQRKIKAEDNNKSTQMSTRKPRLF